MKDTFTNTFGTLEQNLNGQQGTYLHQLRSNGIEAFSKLGLPTSKHEDWKYSNVSFLKRDDVKPSTQLAYNSQVTESDYNSHSYLKANRLIFVNGIYQKQLSSIIDNDDAFTIKSINEVSVDTLQPYFGKLTNINNEAFIALNTAYFQDGVFIHLKKSAVIEHPILVIHLADDNANAEFIHPRNLVVAEENSQCRIIEDFQNLSSTHKFYCNRVAEYFLSQAANVDVTTIQNEANNFCFIGTKEVSQARDSHFKNISASLAGKFVRNDLNINYKDERCNCDLQGLYFADGENLIDNHLKIDHAVPRCESNQLYKGILDEKGIGVFNGKIFVREDAQQTNAYQTNNNLLLSDTAKINTKPQLEIFADDVKCSHGATSGQLDKQALFYLMARGLNKDKAKSLLTYAFGSEVLENISIHPLKEYLQKEFQQKLNLSL